MSKSSFHLHNFSLKVKVLKAHYQGRSFRAWRTGCIPDNLYEREGEARRKVGHSGEARWRSATLFPFWQKVPYIQLYCLWCVSIETKRDWEGQKMVHFTLDRLLDCTREARIGLIVPKWHRQWMRVHWNDRQWHVNMAQQINLQKQFWKRVRNVKIWFLPPEIRRLIDQK